METIKDPNKIIKVNATIRRKYESGLQYLAKKDNLNMARFAGNAIERHIEFYHKIDRRHDIPLPKDLLKLIYAAIDPKKIPSIAMAQARYGKELLKSTGKIDDPVHTLMRLKSWFYHVDEKLIVKKDETHERTILISSQHCLGKNWSIISIQAITNMLKSFFEESKFEKTSNFFQMKVKLKEPYWDIVNQDLHVFSDYDYMFFRASK